MNVSLTPELERLVSEKVESGLYGSASEVVREALRLLHESQTFRQIRLEEVRREIGAGTRQARQGRVRPFSVNDIRAEGRRRMPGRRAR
jgi:antitoxin ParD1/3/4